MASGHGGKELPVATEVPIKAMSAMIRYVFIKNINNSRRN